MADNLLRLIRITPGLTVIGEVHIGVDWLEDLDDSSVEHHTQFVQKAVKCNRLALLSG